MHVIWKNNREYLSIICKRISTCGKINNCGIVIAFSNHGKCVSNGFKWLFFRSSILIVTAGWINKENILIQTVTGNVISKIFCLIFYRMKNKFVNLALFTVYIFKDATADIDRTSEPMCIKVFTIAAAIIFKVVILHVPNVRNFSRANGISA